MIRLSLASLLLSATAAFAYFITSRLMGGDYDAAVISGGQVAAGLATTAVGMSVMQTLTERLMTYGLGRKLEHTDMPTVRRIVRRRPRRRTTGFRSSFGVS
ncbi:MAG: DUF1585 domain-containing protein [Rhodobacteraceae bacterium]|nr:DUF1585 domain-containing protein [Paracoccaceae bacterium]